MALGEIPDDIGGAALSEIETGGKMTPAIYRRLAERMAERGLSHIAITPFDRNPPPVTEKHNYFPKNPFYLLLWAFIQFIFIFGGFLVGQVYYGVRVVGRRNLRKVKRAVTVSNHIGYLDPILTRRMAGFKRLHITVAPCNAGRGPLRPVMKAAGVMPFGTDFAGMKNFNRAVEKAARKGLVHFYGEQSMWLKYPPPRPLREGAFRYAVNLAAPVVPVFYAYRKSGRLRKLLHLHPPITIVIGSPISAQEGNKRAAAEVLKGQTEQFMREAYERYSSLT